MMYIIVGIYIFFTILLLRVFIAKKILEIEYEFSLKHGNKKRAMFFGNLYYRCFTAAERREKGVLNITKAIANDLETYQLSHS